MILRLSRQWYLKRNHTKLVNNGNLPELFTTVSLWEFHDIFGVIFSTLIDANKFRILYSSSDCPYNNRLRPFHAIDRRWKDVYYVLCNDRDPTGLVPLYRYFLLTYNLLNVCSRLWQCRHRPLFIFKYFFSVTEFL